MRKSIFIAILLALTSFTACQSSGMINVFFSNEEVVSRSRAELKKFGENLSANISKSSDLFVGSSVTLDKQSVAVTKTESLSSTAEFEKLDKSTVAISSTAESNTDIEATIILGAYRIEAKLDLKFIEVAAETPLKATFEFKTIASTLTRIYGKSTESYKESITNTFDFAFASHNCEEKFKALCDKAGPKFWEESKTKLLPKIQEEFNSAAFQLYNQVVESKIIEFKSLKDQKTVQVNVGATRNPIIVGKETKGLIYSYSGVPNLSDGKALEYAKPSEFTNFDASKGNLQVAVSNNFGGILFSLFHTTKEQQYTKLFETPKLISSLDSVFPDLVRTFNRSNQYKVKVTIANAEITAKGAVLCNAVYQFVNLDDSNLVTANFKFTFNVDLEIFTNQDNVRILKAIVNKSSLKAVDVSISQDVGRVDLSLLNFVFAKHLAITFENEELTGLLSATASASPLIKDSKSNGELVDGSAWVFRANIPAPAPTTSKPLTSTVDSTPTTTPESHLMKFLGY